MNLNIRHHDINATIDGGDIRLEQDIGAGETHCVLLSPEQFLLIADKLRGIVRPTAETEESRKLRVIADKLNGFVADKDFRRTLLEGQEQEAYSQDWLEKLDCLDDLAWEYAYGLQPDNQKPVDSVQSAGGEAKTKSKDNLQPELLNV